MGIKPNDRFLIYRIMIPLNKHLFCAILVDYYKICAS